MRQQILLLTTPSSYRLEAFMRAAERLGVRALVAEDAPAAMAGRLGGRVGIDFNDEGRALADILAIHAEAPLAAVIAVDDSGAMVAARASAALGLPHNRPEAAEAARDKHLMRRLFAAAGVPSPAFRLCSTGEDLGLLAAQVSYPCVLKPLRLNGSRGVIRADGPAEFVAAARRISRLLERVDPTPGPKPFLAEDFIPGFEVALEGVIDGGELRVLALFDKPDPLDGPFFEETLYVTPSRLPAEAQAQIGAVAARAAAAVGLERGPLHAELRVNDRGPWMVELAGRTIGGLCSQTLQFGTDASLEELILSQAAGLPAESLGRTGGAGGVMMIPIPQAGVLRAVRGLEDARAVPGVERVEISAPLHYPLVPLPEGDSYLGFIFARAAAPAEAEAALRAAHACLTFEIMPNIPMV
ncbi:ATP-grasp domain-containing protein [Oscillochloris sp. ZM17-4]|uniref:ATP-grasp domain-containing protein n=1 Tax=Oscillochloris sp. ZM17-4 TaxID=2866714 RepID=UPI001C733F11|nr:ATP-grasp domain-containing protein [Oscillochloris sp. ZM17-4]MBX0328738.1 ATP-grasp domain-containing protein [Oscillochloris sp. ZM17-4]